MFIPILLSYVASPPTNNVAVPASNAPGLNDKFPFTKPIRLVATKLPSDENILPEPLSTV